MRQKSRLNLDGLNNIRRNIGTGIQTARLNTAYKIAEDASYRAPKDTTFLSESIHIAAFDFTYYDISHAVAMETFDYYKSLGKTPKGRYLGPKSQYYFFPEVRPTNPNEVWVVVGAMHGGAIEYGPNVSQAFLAPAVYDNRGTLTTEIRKAFDGMSVRATISKFTRLPQISGAKQ